MAKFGEKELERRLTLYQVFFKLYENHSSLLDEILQLEDVSQPSFTELKLRYIQGVVDDSVVYIMTNLCDGETLSLQQPQQIWTIGCDRTNGICVSEKYVSRHHGAIQYIDNQGFYLIDFNSTNGSYINGEPLYQPTKLKDGDRIRLGSLTFSFFINLTTRVLPTVAVESLMQLPQISTEVDISSFCLPQEESWTQKLDDTLQILNKTTDFEEIIIAEQKSEILDRFLSKQAPNYPI